MKELVNTGIFAMKFRIVVFMLLALALFGCGAKKQDKRHDHQVEKEVPVKPDFHKAAMLNIEMGQSYLAQGYVSRAKQKFVHALELQPKLPEAHSAIAYFYETVGDLDEAEKHHNSAVTFGTGKGRFYNNYGTFLCRQKRFKEADRAFNNALKDKQYIKTAEVYENAGLCALQHADNSKAYEYLKSAVKHDPNRTNACLELANIELQRENPKSAIYYLKLFKQNGQASAKSLYLSVRSHQQLQQEDELASALLQLKSLFPDSKEYKEILEAYK